MGDVVWSTGRAFPFVGGAVDDASNCSIAAAGSRVDSGETVEGRSSRGEKMLVLFARAAELVVAC